MDYTTIVLEAGALGGLIYLGGKFLDKVFALAHDRSTRADKREQSMLDLQTNMQHIQSNHLTHNTEALERVKDVVVKNTEAFEATGEIIARCKLIQGDKQH